LTVKNAFLFFPFIYLALDVAFVHLMLDALDMRAKALKELMATTMLVSVFHWKYTHMHRRLQQ
jgi:hypothetical protein